MSPIRQILLRTVCLLVMTGVALMGHSVKVRHFDYNDLLVESHEQLTDEVCDDWVDYFLMRLAEEGDDLPSKYGQVRTATQATLRFVWPADPLFAPFNWQQTRLATPVPMPAAENRDNANALLPAVEHSLLLFRQHLF